MLNISQDKKLKKIKDFSIKRNEFEKLIESQECIFNKYSNKINYVKSIDSFCDNSTCNFGNINKSFYSDRDHLSNYGSLKMMDKIISILE